MLTDVGDDGGVTDDSDDSADVVNEEFGIAAVDKVRGLVEVWVDSGV